MKKQKGMTLVEIVISMAIYGLLALLLTEIMTCVNASMRATHQLNTRLSYEAKYADNQLTSGANANFTLNQHDFIINYDSGSKHINDDLSSPNHMDAFEWTANMFDENIVGERYATDINYRFMKFAHQAADLSSYPGVDYQIIIRPVAYFSDDPQVIANNTTWMQHRQTQAQTDIQYLKEIKVINGTLVVPVDDTTATDLPTSDPAYTISGSGGGHFAAGDLNQDFTLHVRNTSNVRTPSDLDVSGQIGFETIAQNLVTVNNHAGVYQRTERDTAYRTFSKPTVTYHMYVRLGDSETNATFYDRTVVEFNVCSRDPDTGVYNPDYGKMRALPALKRGTTLPTHPLPA